MPSAAQGDRFAMSYKADGEILWSEERHPRSISFLGALKEFSGGGHLT